ncbi:MAG TPA: hypothetical protein VF411_13185, partial [Bacteroidia bacterium]
MSLRSVYLFLFLILSPVAFSQSAKKIAKQAKKDYKAKNYRAAIDGYTKALALKPNTYNYIVGRGTSHEMYAKLKEAIADFKQAITLKPKTGVLYMQVADLSIRLNDYNTAATYCDDLSFLDKK